ncbi:MAG: FAD-binding protein [Atribacterota bacterium]|nr:FAD-binding protein [Atribacterota bacterium]
MSIKWNHQTDVIIIGLGGAGGCAAIEAHTYGSKVIVLEKQPENRHYSNTRMSGGGFHSPEPSGDKKALKNYVKAMFSGENLPWKIEGEQPDYSEKLAEIWVEYAPQNINFMQSLDPDFKVVLFGKAAFPYFPGSIASKYTCYSGTYSGKVTKEYSNNSDAINLKKELQQKGEAFHLCILNGLKKRNIEVHYNTRAIELIPDCDGKIIGVKAKQNDNQLFYKATKGVILASGGYEYNKRMRRSFLEGPGVEGWAFYGTTENTGDGIEMALKVGAGLSKIGKAAARLIAAVPVRKYGLKIGLITPSVGKPHEIVVDNYGNRYANERRVTQNPSCYNFYKEATLFDSVNLNYPRIPSWMIFDENLRTRGPLTYLRVANCNFIPWTYDNMDAIEKEWILKALNIRDLALKIKNHTDNRGLMKEDVLINTVYRFNNFCKNGKDLDFGRDKSTMGTIDKPPFYAIPLYIGGPNTEGGLLADDNRQVLDWKGKPIKGLYCAGEISSVFQFAYQAGGNLAECIVFGRIAGKVVSIKGS